MGPGGAAVRALAGESQARNPKPAEGVPLLVFREYIDLLRPEDIMALELELETYEAKLPELRAAYEGKFVLVHGTEIVGIFPAFEDAVGAGYENFGLTPFFVEQIGPRKQIVFVPRIVTIED